MNGLHPIKMPSAKEKVAAELRKAILSRQLQEGEAVTLESVANQLEVSVMPVREAFQILARDGLIKLQRNKGAVVLGINETYIREHYQLRAILESAAAEMCCAPEVDITRIEESYECAAESIQNNDFAAYADQNREFHSEIWSAAGNSRMENMIAELWNGLSMGSMIRNVSSYHAKQGRYADKLPLRRNRRTDRRCQNMAFPVFFISQKPSIYKPNV